MTEIIAGVGAGTLDIYRPRGHVGFEFETDSGLLVYEHVPGDKAHITHDDFELMRPVLAAEDCQERIGGNAVNALAWLACYGAHAELVSVLGTNDVSEKIRTGLAAAGIAANHTITVPGYEPSVSIVERISLGNDRMIRGVPRMPMGEHLPEEQIGQGLHGASAALVSSTKSSELTRRAFRTAPADTLLSSNPGSSDFRDDPQEIIAAMKEERQPDLLALNSGELRQLFRAPK